MSKRFLAVIAVIILAFIGIVVVSNHKSSSSGANSSKTSSHVEGLGKDNVTLVEYGDYQCPYCGEYFSIVKQVEAQFNDQIKFQFVNFPLVSIHQNAFAGARAAEAAAMQNKFWQMHDLLYEENQLYYNTKQSASTWINASDPLTAFNQYAKELGLNVNKFDTDYSSTAVNDVINADMNKGNKLGVNATPSFYLDGKQIQVNNSLSAFQQYINAEIAKKTVNSTASTPAKS